MAKTGQEREADARQEKLTRIAEQVSSGDLVIREMTKAERAKWVQRRSILAAASTPSERARRAAAIENRRKRAKRVS